MVTEESLIKELLHWIQRLQSFCFEFNSALIAACDLRNKPELRDYNTFFLPMRAVRLGLLPHRGIIAATGSEPDIVYHVHGTGISFNAESKPIVHFEYFPQTESVIKPVLDLWSVQQFILSVSPENELGNNQLLTELLEQLFLSGNLIRLHANYLQFYLK